MSRKKDIKSKMDVWNDSESDRKREVGEEK